MSLEPDADGLFRCPTEFCGKYWMATRLLPAQQVFPTPRGVDGMFRCPAGCGRQYETFRKLYLHYAHQRTSGDAAHSGKICAATPKNLLSPTDYEDCKKHLLQRSCHRTVKRPNQWQHPVADQSLEPDTAPDHIAGTVANNDKYIYIDIDKIPQPTAVAIAHAESDTSNPDIPYVDAEAKLDTETADSGVPSNHEQCIPPATQVVYSEASGDVDIVGNDSAEIQSSTAAAATADEYLAAHALVAGWSSCMSVSLAYHGALTTPPSQPSTRPNSVLLKMLPPHYQYSVLVQGHQAGLVPLTTLQHASSQPPTIVHPLTGMEGLHLLNKIKRQVAFRFHSDKSAGVECDMYKEFNSRVDELTKARSGSEGWTRYNHALSEEIDAAQQYLGCVVDCAV